MSNDNLVIVEYSLTQGCFHIISLQDACRMNVGMIIHGVSNDYLPVAAAHSREEADRLYELIKDRLRKVGVITKEG